MAISKTALFDEMEKIAKTRLMKEVVKEIAELGPEWAAKLEANPARLRVLTRAQEGVASGTIPDISRRQILPVAGKFGPTAQVNLSPAPTYLGKEPGGVAAAKLLNPPHARTRDVKDIGARKEHEAYELAERSWKRDKELFPNAWRPDIATVRSNGPVAAPRPPFQRIDAAGQTQVIHDWDPLAGRLLGTYPESTGADLTPKQKRQYRLRERRMGQDRREIAAEQQQAATRREERGGRFDPKWRSRPEIVHNRFMDVSQGKGMTPEKVGRLADYIDRTQHAQNVGWHDMHQGNVGWVTRTGKPRNPALYDLGFVGDMGRGPKPTVRDIIRRIMHPQSAGHRQFGDKDRQAFVDAAEAAVDRLRARRAEAGERVL